MAKVHDNPITEGLSGRLGRSRLQFRKGRNGKTVVALNPVFSENRVFTEANLAQQEAFKQATQYAKVARTQPLYMNLARGADANPYNLAIADWFGKPEVLEIDPGSWSGEIGLTIRVKAQDDTRVVSVQVTIQHADGTIYEQGQAMPSETDGSWWVYTATQDVLVDANTRVIATAKDLPGNSDSMTWQTN